MSQQQQNTTFNKTEIYDSRKGQFKREIKANNLMNIGLSVTNSTTGSVTLTSTVVGTNEEVYLYNFMVSGTTARSYTLEINNIQVAVFDALNTIKGATTIPSAPFGVAYAGSTISVKAHGLTTTAETFIIAVTGAIEPDVTRVEHA